MSEITNTDTELAKIYIRSVIRECFIDHANKKYPNDTIDNVISRINTRLDREFKQLARETFDEFVEKLAAFSKERKDPAKVMERVMKGK